MRTSHARHLDEIEFALRELVAEFDPDAVALSDAPKVWQTAARVVRGVVWLTCGGGSGRSGRDRRGCARRLGAGVSGWSLVVSGVC